MSITTSTDTGEEGEGLFRGYSSIALLVIFILCPPAFIAGIGMWLLFSYKRFRIRRSVLAAGVGIYMLLTLPFYGLLVPMLIQAYTRTIPAIIGGQLNPLAGYIQFVLQQAPITLPLGALVGLAYCSYRWFSRASWEEWTFRLAPWEIWARKRHIEDIVYDRHAPASGATLGVTKDGRKIIQSMDEASMHSFVVGASGAGKTTTLLAAARDSIRQGNGYIFVDMKATPVVPAALAKYAKRYGRNFYHFTLQTQGAEYTGPDPLGPAYYDPIAHGDATRRKDLLVDIRNYGDNGEHYKMLAEYYLQMAFLVLIETQKKGVSTFNDLVTLLDPKELGQRAQPLGKLREFHEVVTQIEMLNEKNIQRDMASTIDSLKAQLGTLFLSSAGQWVRLDPDRKRNHNIDLYEVVKNGDVVCFSLDSQNYPSLAPLIGTLIIQDLKTLASDLLKNPVNNTIVTVLDEFASIGNMNIINLINKSRESGMPIMLSTQVIGDLDRVDPTFAKSLFGIINCFMIHRATTEKDAEEFASLTGTVKRKKFRQSVEHRTSLFGFGRASGTGGGTVEDVEEYLVLPNEIRKLQKGNMIYIASQQQRVERVAVIQEAANLDRKLAEADTGVDETLIEMDEARVEALPDVDAALPTPDALLSARTSEPVQTEKPLAGLEDEPDAGRGGFDTSFNLAKARKPFPGSPMNNPFLGEEDEPTAPNVPTVTTSNRPAFPGATSPSSRQSPSPSTPPKRPVSAGPRRPEMPVEIENEFDRQVKPTTPKPPKRDQSRYEF